MTQQQAPIMSANPMNQTASSVPHTMNAGSAGMQPVPPSVSTPSIIQQQLTNNNTTPMPTKHQPPYGINSYVDPLEHSLASLEQPQMNNNSQKNSSQDMNAMLLDIHKQQLLLSHMAPHLSHAPGANGFGSDFNGANGAVNNLMNMLVLPAMNPSSLLFSNSQMKNVVPHAFPDSWNNLQGNNAMVQQLNAQQQHAAQQQQQQQAAQQQQQQQQMQQQQQQSAMKQEKIMLTPKPIEELLMNPNDKTKGHGGNGGGPNFGQAFNKYEQQNLKNASSWSQLAAAGSPQNPGASTITASKSKVPSDTFQEYRTKAKEQAQRQKQEQEKMKKQKEQELKRQQESLQKHKSSSDDMSNGHRFVGFAICNKFFFS